MLGSTGEPLSVEVTPSGRPTTVTSSPPSSRRLATRLASAKRHGIDQAGAALDIVDAEIVELHLQQLAGDPVRGVEAERERALEVGLGLGELLLGRAFLGQAADLVLDDVDGLGRCASARVAVLPSSSAVRLSQTRLSESR